MSRGLLTIGALQGLDPDRIIYAGSASKTLAPALRLGWLIVATSLLQAVIHEKILADRGTPASNSTRSPTS